MVCVRKQLKQRQPGQPESSGDFDVPLWITQGNNTYICLTDGNKNIRQLKNTSGTTVEIYDYDPFGKVSGSGTVTQPWQFSSEYFDSETGLVYYNYRYYSPELGRWTRRDPIEEEGGVNLYGMCHNQVISASDGLGWDWLDCTADCIKANDIFYALEQKGITILLGGGFPKDWFIKSIFGKAIHTKQILYYPQ